MPVQRPKQQRFALYNHSKITFIQIHVQIRQMRTFWNAHFGDIATKHFVCGQGTELQMGIIVFAVTVRFLGSDVGQCLQSPPVGRDGQSVGRME